MQIPLRVTFHGTEPSEAIEARVRAEVDALERFHDRITGCQVTIDRPARHQHKGSALNVRVVMAIPGGDVAVNRDPGKDHAHEDVYVAIRDAFAAARRQLQASVRDVRAGVEKSE